MSTAAFLLSAAAAPLRQIGRPVVRARLPSDILKSDLNHIQALSQQNFVNAANYAAQ
jgi:hypothetical protein